MKVVFVICTFLNVLVIQGLCLLLIIDVLQIYIHFGNIIHGVLITIGYMFILVSLIVFLLCFGMVLLFLDLGKLISPSTK